MDKLIVMMILLGLAAAFGATKATESPLDFKVKSIDDKQIDLSEYKGKVVLIVNVASHCGNTPQYEGLQKIYKKYSDKGFVVLGFPANEFGAQEPGTNAEIKKFCRDNYQVDFPMFSKIVVKGEGIAPLYDYLTSEKTNPKFSGPITWNFEKFLIGRNGQVIGRFTPKTGPEKAEVVEAIETELAKK